MSEEKDTALIVKELWESVDSLVGRYNSENANIKRVLEGSNLSYDNGFDKSELIGELLNRLDKLQSEKDEFELNLLENEEKFDKIEKIEKSNSELNNKIKELSEEKEKFLDEISNLRKLEKDIEFTKQEISRKNKDLNAKVSEVERLKEDIASKDNLIYKLQNSTDKSEVDKEIIEQYELEKVKLTEENEHLNKKLNKYEEELKETQFTVEEFNRKLLTLNEEKFDSNRKIEQLKRNYELLNTRNNNLDKENEELQARINELNVYKKLLDIKENEIAELNNEVRALREDNEEKNAQITKAKEEALKIEESRSSNSVINIDEINQEKEYYKEKLKKAEIILAEINKQMSDKDRLIEEIRNGKDLSSESLEQNKNLKEENEVLKQELQASKDLQQIEYKNELIDINGLIEKLKDQDDKVNQLESNLENMSNLAEKRLMEIQELQLEKEANGNPFSLKEKDKLILQIDDLVEKLEKFAV